MTWLLLSISLVPSPARACPGGPSASSEPRTEGRVASEEAAAHTATRASLIGANCSYSTGSMARRVMDEGIDWSAEDRLARTSNDHQNHVAAPFVLSGDPAVHIVASELLQLVPDPDATPPLLALSGRSLEVDGVRYVVLTAFRVVQE